MKNNNFKLQVENGIFPFFFFDRNDNTELYVYKSFDSLKTLKSHSSVQSINSNFGRLDTILFDDFDDFIDEYAQYKSLPHCRSNLSKTGLNLEVSASFYSPSKFIEDSELLKMQLSLIFSSIE